MGLNFSTNNSTQKYTGNVAYVHFFTDATKNITIEPVVIIPSQQF